MSLTRTLCLALVAVSMSACGASLHTPPTPRVGVEHAPAASGLSIEELLEAFVHTWFAAFERRAPGSELATYLDPAVTFRFPDRTIEGATRFAAWYDGLQPGIASWKFTVHDIAVGPSSTGRHTIHLLLRREVVTTAGERFPFEADETWEVEGRPGSRLAIVSYTEIEAAPRSRDSRASR